MATVTPAGEPGQLGGVRTVPPLTLSAAIGPVAGVVGTTAAEKQASVYMGDGLPPVPGRLAERIKRWEFVEMHELLPELLASQKAEDGGEKRPNTVKGRRRVKDIAVWLQCFAVWVSVVSRSFPEVVPELMAYMASIIRASQEYEGAAWEAYDAAFRRQAAATGQREWSKINPTLYTICFTGKACRSQRCDICLSATHKTVECYGAVDEDPDMSRRVRAVESAMVAFSSSTHETSRERKRNDICRLFNERRCLYRNCKYRHLCKWCEGQHAGIDCRSMAKTETNGGPGPIRREAMPKGGAAGRGNPY